MMIVINMLNNHFPVFAVNKLEKIIIFCMNTNSSVKRLDKSVINHDKNYMSLSNQVLRVATGVLMFKYIDYSEKL